MNLYLLERFGDFDMRYPYIAFETPGTFNYKEAVKSFKERFNITTIDNTTETLDKFVSFCKKNYGITPVKFKGFTICEE